MLVAQTTHRVSISVNILSKFVAHPFCYESTQRPMIFLQNIGYASNVFAHYYCCWSSTFLLITNRLSLFWKSVVPTKHCNTIYSRLAINFLNPFKCFCGNKTSFPAKTYRCTFFNCFLHYDLWHGQNRQVTSRCKCVQLATHYLRTVTKRERTDEIRANRE